MVKSNSTKGKPRVLLQAGAAAVLLSAAVTCHSAPYLLKDINTAVNVGSEPGPPTVVGGILYFAADDGTTGRELWKTDGTAAGTVQVADLNPGAGSSSPHELVDVAGTLFFVAETFHHGEELWRSDGTRAGTALVADIAPGPQGSRPTDLVAVGSQVFFVAASGTRSWLFRSDGTPEGTFSIFDLGVYGESQPTVPMRRMGDQLVFIWEGLRRSDGTIAGTTVLTELPAAGFAEDASLPGVGDEVFFRVEPDGRQELWKSDGTLAGTAYVAAIPHPGHDGLVQAVGTSSLLFLKICGRWVDGCELWRSDGTEAGTSVLRKTYPEFDWDDESPPAVTYLPLRDPASDGAIFFWDVDASETATLWQTDGTIDGTVPVPNAGGHDPQYRRFQVEVLSFAVNGKLFFRGCDDDAGCELWTSDGTADGTLRVADITPGEASTRLAFGAALGSTIYFLADEPESGAELWRSDGTASGTTRVVDLHPNAVTEDSSPGGLTNVGGLVYFTAYDRDHGYEPWRSDGTPEGTMLVVDMVPGIHGGSPTAFTALGGSVYFFGGNPFGLWRTDRTTGGTSRIAPLAYLGQPAPRVVGGSLYFVAVEQPGSLYELWRSDGTPAGTVRLPVSGNAYAFRELEELSGNVVFQLAEADAWRLWRSDGTPEGTERVSDVPLAYDTPIRRVDDVLYFGAGTSELSLALWKTDGTAIGTAPIVDIPGRPGYASAQFVAANHMLFFTAVGGSELWRTDGTPAGTIRLLRTHQYPRMLTALGDGLIFRSFSFPSDGRLVGLWHSDGTPGGTVRIANAGSDSSGWERITTTGGVAFFDVYDSGGTSVWRTDGTSRGTVPVTDIPRQSSYVSVPMAVLGMQMLFSARDPVKGVELHALSLVPRCGDGVLDDGEDCDDGNLMSGDCCAPTCRFESPGAMCPDDGNVCTDDVCDGAGLCGHVANGASCEDGDACTTDVCRDGVCVGTPDPVACVDAFLCRAAGRSRNPTGDTLPVKPLQDLCLPASVEGGPIRDPSTRLLSYPLKKRAQTSESHAVAVRNLFGELELRTRGSSHVLLPSTAEGAGQAGAPRAARYVCDRVRAGGRGASPRREAVVSVLDPPVAMQLSIDRPRHVCAEVPGLGGAPSAGLVCYPVVVSRVEPATRIGRDRDASGGRKRARPRGIRTLCVNSSLAVR